MGAHVRRLHPRSGLVLGVPFGRRLIRRGMPYGAAYDPRKPTNGERGLVGLFICGDLESQFEFLLRVWANKDLSTRGIRGTKDPFAGARDSATPFQFFADEAAAQPMTVEVPMLARTAGSLYLLVPGMAGLKWLADAGWTSPAAMRMRWRS